MAPLHDHELAELGDLNRREFERTTTRWSGAAGAVVERDGVLCWSSATDFPVLLNGAARLDPRVDATDAVATAIGYFDAVDREAGGGPRGFSMSLRDDHPLDDPVRDAAVAAGLLALSGAPEMAVTEPVGTTAPAPGVELHWVDGGDAVGAPGVADFVAISDAAYQSLGMTAGAIRRAVAAPHLVAVPGTRIVVATVDGEPAGTAMSLLSHGIAGVYFVGTLEAARGRGVGELVTRAVTDRAFDDGARAVTLQASAMGEAIYARMGYRELYRYTSYVRFPAA